MRNIPNRSAKKLSEVSYFGREILLVAGLVTLTITPSLTIDVFNPPKFAVLVLGVIYIGLRNWKRVSQSLANQRDLIIYFSFFAIYLIVLVVSSYSISERLFGIEGRNFGFITLLAFTLLGFYSYQATKVGLLNSRKIINSLTLTNFAVCILFLLQDKSIVFVEYNNDYGVLPSTLGNPNFLSAFIGISFIGVVIWTLQNKSNLPFFMLGIMLTLYSIYTILRSNSIQGLVALAISFLVFAMVLSLSQFSKIINLFFLSFLLILTVIVAFGFFNFGPLADRLTQTTLQNRIIYWEIAIRMLRDSPLFGKGFDSYLDNYRQFVTLSDYETLGGPVISDSPHNLYLDLFVSGGLLLGLSLLSLILLASIRGLNVLRFGLMVKKFDTSTVALFAIYISFLSVCMISPFQIGLFVWLPVIMGYFLGLSLTEKVKVIERSFINQKALNLGSSVILSISFLACNFVFAILPLATENRFRNAVEEKSSVKLRSVALDWPFSGVRAISISQGFINASLGSVSPGSNEEMQLIVLRNTALEIATAVVEINENQVEGWRFLLQYSPDVAMKMIAKERLKELDPTNPEWKTAP
jgi:O-antigen ligase